MNLSSLYRRFQLLALLITGVFSQGAPVITMPNGSTLYASYNSATSTVQYNAIVMQNTYLAIGYGTTMENTDMAFWGANGEDSVMYDMYATGNKLPSIDTVNSYTTTTQVLANGSVLFTSTRVLEPATDPETFVIQIGTPINMICAYLNTTSSLSYHGSSNKFQFTLTFNSDGSATASGGLQPIQSGPLISLPNGSQLATSYDEENDVIVYDLLLMDQSYIAVGYGTSMSNTDMVYWGANGEASLQQDLWATGNKAPAVDSVNAYSTTFTVNPDNSVSFRSVRPLAPDESTETFVIQLNTPINMIVAYKTTGYTLSYHGADKFSWTMQLNSDGTSGGTSTGSQTGLSAEKATNIHGLLMWASWSILGLVQIITNRYFKHHFKWAKPLHAITGLLLCATVITGFVFIFTFVMDQEIDLDDLHPLLGNAVVLTGVLVTLGGLATAYFMGFSDMSWKTNTVLLIRGLHSKFAYATLLVSQAAIMTGIILHFGLTNPQLGKMLVICNLTGYIAVLGLFEVCHRRMLIQEDPFRNLD